MDMSFIRTSYDGFSVKYPNIKLIGTFYNYLDLLASKDSGREEIDGRLDFLKNEVFLRMMNEKLIIWEPYFEIIRENYPEVKFGKTIHKRIYEDFLPYIDEIIDYGKDVRQELKDAVIRYSEDNQVKKRKQILDFNKYSSLFKSQIISENNDPNNLSFWILKVETLLKDLIWNYATIGNYLPSNFRPNMSTFSINSCELFINVLAKYLQNANTANPNDNIDVLTLLYVRNGRKLLMRDRKWTTIINELGLGEKYLHPLE